NAGGSRVFLSMKVGRVRTPIIRLPSDRREPGVSLPKIISARSDGAVPPRWEWRQWYRIVGSLDPAAHPCARISASAIDYNRKHMRSESAAGASRRRRPDDPSTRGAMCQSDVPHSHFARVIEEKSVGLESPWPLTGS